jgi:hypothetical protein
VILAYPHVGDAPGRCVLGRRGRIRSRLRTFCPEGPSSLRILHADGWTLVSNVVAERALGVVGRRTKRHGATAGPVDLFIDRAARKGGSAWVGFKNKLLAIMRKEVL